MFQVRIHGRGGQGVVTAAELLSAAAFAEGRYAQAFPSFGSERTGAPVVAFCRMDEHDIRVREPVVEPDAVIVQDVTLLHHVDVFAGLRPRGFVLCNSARTPDELGIASLASANGGASVLCVPATELAIEHLGRPVPNVVLLGGFAALTGMVSLDALADAVRERFPAKLAAGNVAAATAAYGRVEAQQREVASAQAG